MYIVLQNESLTLIDKSFAFYRMRRLEVRVGPYPPALVQNEVCGDMPTYDGKDEFVFGCPPSNHKTTRGRLGRYISAQMLVENQIFQVEEIRVHATELIDVNAFALK